MFILMGPTAFATPPPLRLPLMLLLVPSTLTREAVVPPSANARPVDMNLLRDDADAGADADADAEDDGEEGVGGTMIGSSGQDRDDGERAVMCNPVTVARL